MLNIEEIQKKLQKFASDRDWDQYHSPKNLAMALAVEASELMEIFQWLTDEESRTLADLPEEMSAVNEEIADVFLYLLRLSDKLNIDVGTAIEEKLNKNAGKYPVELAKGNATKYNRRK